jgi:predicted acetyltransferase
MAEFREVPPERYVDFQAFVDYAFHPSEGPQSYESRAELPVRQGTRLGLFEEREQSTEPPLRCICTHYDFTARVREQWLPLAGLASVATMPEDRRQGYVGRLVDSILARWRADDYPFAALWPFEWGYYEQFGWATGSAYTEYTLPPDTLGFARERAGDVRLERLTDGDWEHLQAAHEAHGADIGLTLRRDDEWWRTRVFRGLETDPYVYGCVRDGEYVGYLTYTVEDDDARELRVQDMAFVDEAVYHAILAFLADHDSQVETVTLYREGTTSTLLDRVADPGTVTCEVDRGAMIRTVDVEHALSTLEYPDDVETTVTLAVTDERAAWNDGVFELVVADGAGACHRVAATPDEVDGAPDAQVDVGTLSQLAIGYHSVDEARRLAGLTVDGVAAETLSACFPPRTVCLREFF